MFNKIILDINVLLDQIVDRVTGKWMFAGYLQATILLVEYYLTIAHLAPKIKFFKKEIRMKIRS